MRWLLRVPHAEDPKSTPSCILAATVANKTPPQFQTLPVSADKHPSGRPARRTTAKTELSTQVATAAQLPGGNKTRLPAKPPQVTVHEGYPPPLDQLDDHHPPRGRRTPAGPLNSDVGADLPKDAPGWMRRARRMALALESAIRAGHIGDATEACIERAWTAWELNGSSDAEIARVAHVVERAHQAIRNTARSELNEAVSDCAEVLWNALPPHVLRSASFDQVVDVVRGLQAEADPWAGVRSATSVLLGWVDASQAHAARAIHHALIEHPPVSGDSDPDA